MRIRRLRGASVGDNQSLAHKPSILRATRTPLLEGFLKNFLAAGEAGPGSKADQKCWKLNTLGSSLDQWVLRKTRNPHHWEESHLEACSTHSACLSHGNDAHGGTLSSSMMHLAAWLSLHPFPTSPQKILRGLLSKKLLACCQVEIRVITAQESENGVRRADKDQVSECLHPRELDLLCTASKPRLPPAIFETTSASCNLMVSRSPLVTVQPFWTQLVFG